MSNVTRLTIIAALVFSAVGTTAPLMTLYLEDLGARFDFIALILTTCSATALTCNYLWGRFSDRLGRRKPLIIGGLLGMALALFTLGRVPNASAAWGVRLFEAISMPAYSTTSLALMGDLLSSGQRRGRRMGIYRGIGSVAFAIGSAMIGGRLADRFSIPISLTVAAGFYLLAALVALTLSESQETVTAATPPLPTLEPQPAPPTSVVDRAASAQRLPWLFLGGVALWTLSHTASATMWTNFMRSIGYNKTTIGSLWGLAALVEGISMPVVGNISDMVGRAPLLAAGGLGISLVQIGYLTVALIIPALVVVQIIRGLGFASFTTSAMTFASELGTKTVRGNNSGTYNAAMGTGQLVGSMIGGTIVQAFGFEFLFGVAAVGALASAVCFGLLHLQQNRVSTAATEVS